MTSVPLPARAALFLFAALSLAPSVVHACSCMTFDHEAAVAAFDVSFRGRVNRVVVEGRDEVITFEVYEIFRGLEARTRRVSVRRAIGIAPCPIPGFQLREVYRVYANRDAHALRVHFCNPSSLVRAVTE